MKDRQVQASPPQMRIPFISAILHCISITAIVFMRSAFGFAYLRPRSVFFAFSWAFALFFIYAWKEKLILGKYWAVCLYGLAVVALYYIHFFTAFFRELYRSGEHDNDSGTPHTIRFLRLSGKAPSVQFQIYWQVWFEPLFVLIGSLALFVVGEKYVSRWLLLVAPCFCLKEMLNFWFQIRQKKRHDDSRVDAEDIFADAAPTAPATEAPKPVGKEKVKRTRATEATAAEDIQERKYAQVLRLLPPYSLEAAETNFKALIKQYHPDPNTETPENTAISAELNEAIGYFRAKKP